MFEKSGKKEEEKPKVIPKKIQINDFLKNMQEENRKKESFRRLSFRGQLNFESKIKEKLLALNTTTEEKKEEKIIPKKIDMEKQSELMRQSLKSARKSQDESLKNPPKKICMEDYLKKLNSLDKDKLEKVKNYLFELYNTNHEVNLNKFQVENIEQKEYSAKDTGLTNIHISTSLSENRIQDVIIHLTSAIQKMSSSSFLHIHIMSTDNFTLETFSKLMSMAHKTNNNTEIIVYNAQQSKSDFKMREDKAETFKKEYARLYALKAVQNIQKLIMLNIDNVMVQKDLSELYETDMNDIYVRGVPEVPGLKYKIDWMDNYLFDKSDYINGDVLLVNMESSQKEDFYNKAVELNNNEFYSKVEDPVQDIINVIMRKKITFLNLKFNKYNFYEKSEDKNDETKWYPVAAESIKYGEKSNHFYTKEELLASDSDPFIINYAWDAQIGKKSKKYEEEIETYSKLNGFI